MPCRQMFAAASSSYQSCADEWLAHNDQQQTKQNIRRNQIGTALQLHFINTRGNWNGS